MRRREFLGRAATAGGGVLLAARALGAQQAPPQGASGTGAEQSSGSSNLFDMNQGAAKRVVRQPKAGARATLSADDRDALERQIRCQCGCTLDVYVCRTTDFSCQVSPAMHRDVIALVEGGYSGEEIIDAFVDTYGEVALMAPTREGFNWAGYLVPFGALAAGGAALVTVLRRMQRRAAAHPAPVRAPGADASLGTADELARLDAAVRRDD
jgi:cytochrome c-type biogenesis protein CcmH